MEYGSKDLEGIIKIDKKELITRGAEAEIWTADWLGRDVVIKKRVKKGYRHPGLDFQIRKERIRKEARLMRTARNTGVPVPIIYDVMEKETTIIMQEFKGERVMESINSGVDVDVKLIGNYLGRLHSEDITHGDLTTSNILYNKETGKFCFIDFSLGEKPSSIEDKGVDLHLLREALISVHADPLELYECILSGYLDAYPEGKEVIDKVKEIESRGRYQ